MRVLERAQGFAGDVDGEARIERLLVGLDGAVGQPAEVAAANRDPSAYPMFNGGIARSLADSYRTFLDDAFWNGGKFDDFFRSRKIFVNADLAPIYGFPAITGTTRRIRPSGRYSTS